MPSGDFTHRKQDCMDELMKHELLVGPDGNLIGSKRVLWEEGIQGRTSSILDILIPKSSLKIQDIHDIKYVKKKDDCIIHGLSVEYDGRVDSTSHICDHVRDHLPDSPIFTNKIHRRMLLTPCGILLTSFKSIPELVNVFLDLVVAHKTMTTQRKVLHGDLSPNNIIIYEGKGYLIDFDHAKFIQLNNKAKDSHGTGTIPYISYRLLKLIGSIQTPDSIEHKASDDLESLFYIILEFTIIYDGPSGLITNRGVLPDNTRRWHKAYVAMGKDGLGTSGTLKEEF
ncbi:uncharacterized protein EDB91DRAFT_1255410 [Suillus paluster]|uniref:uncharacterized protein n=1 Tax=Suillus paluster TaxID=48578 RepID=UPI001B877DBC|nr:uncharacterized protein EDB91DRAFT_1255410 [Suillus paluster]KAG1724107.1 hypothetical protein EDB91DRAFT_1255410 [Suillus paluster]